MPPGSNCPVMKFAAFLSAAIQLVATQVMSLFPDATVGIS